MSILDRLRPKINQKIVNLIFNALKGLSVHWLNQPGSSKQLEKVGDGRTADVIMSPVLWVADRMAECPLAVKTEDDETLDRKHNAVRLLAKPNPWYTGADLIKAMSVDVDLDGNGYALKVRNGITRPKELWYVPWYMMEPHVPEGEGYIDYYLYTPGGMLGQANYGTYKVLPEDVIHVRNGIDPYNIRKGLSNLHILLKRVFTDEQVANFTASLLGNMGIPGVMIVPVGDAVITPDDAKILKAKWKEEFKNDRTGEPFVPTSAVKVEQFGFSPKELDLSVLSDIPEERVCALLHLPASVVGFGTGMQQTKVGATMTEQRSMAYEDCIIPHQQMWGRALDMQVLAEFDTREDRHIAFDLSGVRCLRDDETKLNDRVLRQFSAGLITRGRALEKIGEEATPDDDVYYIGPMTMIIPKAEANGQAPPPEPSPPPKGIILKARMDPKIARLMRKTREDHQRFSDTQAFELRKRFRDLGEKAAKAWLSLAESLGIKRQLDDAEIANELANGMDFSGVDYAPHFVRVLKQTIENLNSILGLGVNMTAQTEQRILTAAGTRRGLLDLAQQTKDAVYKALTDGRAVGEGAAELAARIEDLVAAGPWTTPEIRATVIARTETKYAQNRSSLEAYRDSPNVVGVRVFDAQLGPTDAECEELNGQIVSVEEAEYLADNEHPNGTRSFAPMVEERGSQGEQLGHAEELHAMNDEWSKHLDALETRQREMIESIVDAVQKRPGDTINLTIDNKSGKVKRTVVMRHADGTETTADVVEETDVGGRENG